MASDRLDRDDLIRGINQVIEKLRAAGQPAGIRIVGGAALALRYFDRRTTTDIDAQLRRRCRRSVDPPPYRPIRLPAARSWVDPRASTPVIPGLSALRTPLRGQPHVFRAVGILYLIITPIRAIEHYAM
jgi:hypothetical protein